MKEKGEDLFLAKERASARAGERAPVTRRLRGVARHLLSLVLTMVIGGFMTAALVRLSPGFGVDEHALDPARDQAALRERAAARPEQRDFWGYCLRRTGALFVGDFGVSENWQRPVRDLLRERVGVTTQLMAIGILGGWGLALAFALPGAIYPARMWSALGTFASAGLLSIPSAALALLLFVWAGPVKAVMALAVFPSVFQYVRNLLRDAAARPHVLAARARGAGGGRILLWHVLPIAAPQALALAGVSVSMAFGAAVAVEVICDFPGIGQLAWKAALARDLPLLVTLTMLVALATQTANAVADLLGARGGAAR